MDVIHGMLQVPVKDAEPVMSPAIFIYMHYALIHISKLIYQATFHHCYTTYLCKQMPHCWHPYDVSLNLPPFVLVPIFLQNWQTRGRQASWVISCIDAKERSRSPTFFCFGWRWRPAYPAIRSFATCRNNCHTCIKQGTHL